MTDHARAATHYRALATEAATLPVCRVCRVILTRTNTTLTDDLRLVCGLTWDHLELRDRCRDSDDEEYGLRCSEGSR